MLKYTSRLTRGGGESKSLHCPLGQGTFQLKSLALVLNLGGARPPARSKVPSLQDTQIEPQPKTLTLIYLPDPDRSS